MSTRYNHEPQTPTHHRLYPHDNHRHILYILWSILRHNGPRMSPDGVRVDDVRRWCGDTDSKMDVET